MSNHQSVDAHAPGTCRPDSYSKEHKHAKVYARPDVRIIVISKTQSGSSLAAERSNRFNGTSS